VRARSDDAAAPQVATGLAREGGRWRVTTAGGAASPGATLPFRPKMTAMAAILVSVSP
jgi:hypothetical protein